MRVFYPQQFLRKMPGLMEKKESALVEDGDFVPSGDPRRDDPLRVRFKYLGFFFLSQGYGTDCLVMHKAEDAPGLLKPFIEGQPFGSAFFINENGELFCLVWLGRSHRGEVTRRRERFEAMLNSLAASPAALKAHIESLVPAVSERVSASTAVEVIEPPRISVTEWRRNYYEFLRRVEQGESFTITRRGKPIAKLVP